MHGATFCAAHESQVVWVDQLIERLLSQSLFTQRVRWGRVKHVWQQIRHLDTPPTTPCEWQLASPQSRIYKRLTTNCPGVHRTTLLPVDNGYRPAPSSTTISSRITWFPVSNSRSPDIDDKLIRDRIEYGCEVTTARLVTPVSTHECRLAYSIVSSINS